MKETKGLRAVSLLLSALMCAVLCTGCGKEAPSWEKHITEEEMIIEGITGEYALLFLTDTHMIVIDEADAKEVTDNAASRAPAFLNAEQVPSAEQFAEWIRYANEEKLDGLLLGGDIIDYPSQANISYLGEQLAALKTPYLYAPGNHDWTYPWEYMTVYARETYLPLLQPYMQEETAIQTKDYGEFMVVAVDNSTNQVDAAALAAYEEVLKQGKPVIVMTHIPFLTQSVLTRAKETWATPVVIGGGNYGGIYPDEASAKFMELTTAADSPVVAVLAGHVHYYDRDYMEGEKKVLQIVGSPGYDGSAVLLHIRGESVLE